VTVVYRCRMSQQSGGADAVSGSCLVDLPIPLARGLHWSTSQLNLSRVYYKKKPYTPPNTPLIRATQPLRAPPFPYKALKLS